MIIAIDGPAASGKSTIAKLVASELAILYIDSGAMYRAVTYQWLEKTNGQKSDDDETLISELLKDLKLELSENSKKIILNGHNISEKIRENIVSTNVSYIASFKEVREKLVEMQREISENQAVIMDGRDIGTVVFPNADLKIFMLASAGVRAKRRQLELEARGEEVDFQALVDQIVARDKQDSEREIAPLKKADDATEIITDDLTIEEVVQEVLKLCKSKK